MLAAALSPTVHAQDANVLEARKLWEKIIEAKGGREKLESVRTLEASTHSYSPSDRKEFREQYSEELFVLPYQWWWYDDESPGWGISIMQFDFEKEVGYDSYYARTFRPDQSQNSADRAGKIDPRSAPFNSNYKEIFFEHQLIYLMETKWLKPEVVGWRNIVDGKQTLKAVAVAISPGSTYEFIIDPSNGLPSRLLVWLNGKTQGEKPRFVYGRWLDSYVSVEGVMLPQSVRLSRKATNKTEYHVNIPYNQSVFVDLPTPATRPDAWKLKQ